MKHFWISLSLFAITFAPDASAQGAAPVAPTEIQVGNALPGSFFATPEGHGPFPVIIILGGSSGDDGDARRLAPRLVAEGYAVFGLTYYSPAWYGRAAKFPELPSAFRDIPVERAAMAKQWLCARKDVNCGAIGIYGVSKGAEFALLAGSLIDGFAAIAAIVPSDVVWEGWGPGTSPGESSSFSWGGKGLPFVPYVEMQEELDKFGSNDAQPRLRLPHDRGRHANPGRAVAARILVEKIDEPVFLAGGDADNTWNSGEMAQSISERRAEAGLPTTTLIFTDAGHGLSGDGTNSEGWYKEPELEAQRTIWPETLKFFSNELRHRHRGSAVVD